jgi:hypothetical protein
MVRPHSTCGHGAGPHRPAEWIRRSLSTRRRSQHDRTAKVYVQARESSRSAARAQRSPEAMYG